MADHECCECVERLTRERANADALIRRMAIELAYANCGGEIERGSSEGEQLVRDAEAFVGRPMKHWAEVACEDGKPWEKPYVCPHEAERDRLLEALRDLTVEVKTTAAAALRAREEGKP